MQKKVLLYTLLAVLLVGAFASYIFIGRSDNSYDKYEEELDAELTDGDTNEDIEQDLKNTQLEDLEAEVSSLNSDIKALELEVN